MAAKRGGNVPGFQDLVNQDLKTKRHRPVYLLAGEDTLRIEGVVEKIRKDALGEAGMAFNSHVFQGDQVDVGRVVQQAMALPMLGAVQVIWLRHVDRCVGDQASQDALERYIAKPVPETILIMTAERVDKRRKWVKTCVTDGYYFDFTPPSGEALVQWVLKAARRENLPLTDEQARTLCELVGNDLLSLKSEIDKLALLCEDRGTTPDAAELERLIMDQAALEGYEITAHLEPGRTADVLRTWFRLAEWGRSGYEVAPLITSRIRKGALLAAGREEGMADREIASLSGQNPWSFRYLEPMLRGLRGERLAESLRAALQCDRALKSSPLKPDVIIEKTIMDLCRRD